MVQKENTSHACSFWLGSQLSLCACDREHTYYIQRTLIWLRRELDIPGLISVIKGERFRNNKSCVIFPCAADKSRVFCCSFGPVAVRLIILQIFLWLSLVSFQVLWLCLARSSNSILLRREVFLIIGLILAWNWDSIHQLTEINFFFLKNHTVHFLLSRLLPISPYS